MMNFKTHAKRIGRSTQLQRQLQQISLALRKNAQTTAPQAVAYTVGTFGRRRNASGAATAAYTAGTAGSLAAAANTSFWLRHGADPDGQLARAEPIPQGGSGALQLEGHRAPKAESVRTADNAAFDPGQNAFVALLRDLTMDRQRAIQAIRAGFPTVLLKDTSTYFNVPANRIRAIARLPETTAHALVKRGANLDAAASERIWRLADVVMMAKDVFEDEEAAKAWLRTPNRTFRDAAPMDYLDTEPGAMSVRQVLNAIATGGAA
ncbi:MAG: antitoxin Xre/MbcA/ParS toxin-binding domain-containing protein [Pseudomonadota bacterium]